MNPPLISFVIFFYNRPVLLKEAVQSILYSPFRDVEIILVDEASNTDGLSDLLEFIKQFKNIKYLRQERNLGPGSGTQQTAGQRTEMVYRRQFKRKNRLIINLMCFNTQL
jgi:GT2 family glycosyltransferase